MLSRLAIRFVRYGAVFALCLSIPCLAQSPNIETEESLIGALAKAAKDEQAASRLLDAHRDVVSAQLWEKLSLRALTAYFRGETDQSLALYGIALRAAASLNDERRIAASHYNLGKTHSSIGNIDAAIRSYLSARAAFEKAGLRRDLIYILSDLGSLYFYASDYKQARAYAEAGLALAERLKDGGDPPGAWPDDYGIAGAWSTIGALSRYEGDYTQAAEQLRKAIALYERAERGTLQFGPQLADNITELSRVYSMRGDHAQALGHLNRALAIAKRLPQREILANVLNSIGVLYLEQEDYEKAGEHLRQSLRIYQAAGNRAESARALLNLGVNEQRQGNFDAALGYFRESLALATEASNKDGMIAAGKGIGIVYRELGRFPEASEALDRSLALATEVDDQVRIAEILWRKAQAHQAMGDFTEAAAHCNRAQRIARQLQLPKLSYLIATTLGRAYLGQNRPDLASQTFSAAIDGIEAMRDQVAGEELGRQLFFELQVSAYHSLIELLAAQGKAFEALQIAERARARVLLDVVSAGRADLASSMTPKEREEDQRLRRLIVALNNEIREARLKPLPDRPLIDNLATQLDAARLQQASFQDGLHASHPELRRRLGHTPALTPEALAELARSRQTTFLEYVVTKERVYLFVVSQEVKLFSIDATADDLARIVEKFHRVLASRQAAYAATARELYGLLIKPVEAELRGRDAICIVPDGVLWEVPFQALRSGGNRFLLEDHAIQYAPSLSVLAQLAKQQSEKPAASPSLLAFGNTASATMAPLPFAEAEVRAAAKLFGPGSKVFLGPEANEKAFKSRASESGILHFSTHGVLDNRHPLNSYLLLAGGDGEEDGLLEAREIMALKLRADVVVLSACETARGRIGAGEGVIGMSWAFFIAGCRSTVVSQWKVSSESTAALLVDFYRTLRIPSAQMTKAQALRSAALKLMKDPRYRHPFYWAGFVVIGDNQ